MIADKTTSQDPKDHIGHNLGIDRWARDFGGRTVPGNAWCGNCAVPVACECFAPGILKREPEEEGQP